MTGQQLLNQLIGMRDRLNEVIDAGTQASKERMATNIPKDIEHDFKCLNEAFQDFDMHAGEDIV